MQFEIVGLSGLVVGIVEAIKSTKLVDNRFIPLVDLFLGLGLALLAYGYTVDSIFNGIVVGLMAAGLYSGVKTVTGK